MDSYDSYFFDCEGVIWKFCKRLPWVRETISKLRELGKNVYYITNASDFSRDDIAKTLDQEEIQYDRENIFVCSYAASLYLQQHGFRKAFVIGEPGLLTECEGFEVISSTSMHESAITCPQDVQEMAIEPGIDAVLVGLDHHFNYYMVCYAVKCLEAGARLIACGTDRHDRLQGKLIPALGPLVESIKTASGVSDVTIIGKPDPMMLKLAEARDGLDLSKAVLFGDKMETDIRCAMAGGLASGLVCTGVETRESAAKFDYAPDYILDSMKELYDSLCGQTN